MTENIAIKPDQQGFDVTKPIDPRAVTFRLVELDPDRIPGGVKDLSANVPLDVFLSKVGTIAERLFDHNGDLSSLHWFAVRAEGLAAVWCTPIASQGAGGAADQMSAAEHKNDLTAMMRGVFNHHNVVRYALASECWMSSGNKYASAGLDPDREEGILIQANDFNGDNLLARYRINRPARGKPSLTEFRIIGRHDDAQFNGLLGHPPEIR